MEVLGHDKPKKFLIQLQKTKKLPSTLIFSGKEGIGKRKLAFLFVKGLFCEEGEAWGCNKCEACQRLDKFLKKLYEEGDIKEFAQYKEKETGGKFLAFAYANHPDIIYVYPEKNEIKIDQVREIKEWLSLKSTSNKGKVVIIEKAHTMNIPSQNAILKILEEPPLGTLFILITSNKGNLLPTILSRAFIVDFTSLKEKEMEEILKEEKNSTIKEILKADQSLRFWKFLKNETVLEIIEKIKNFKKLTHSEIIEIAEKSENIEEKENLIEILELLFYTQLKEGKISLKNYEAIEKILSQIKLGIKRGIKLKLAVETLLFISKIN